MPKPALMAAIGTRCPYCNHFMTASRPPTRDHIHPKSKGGSLGTPGNKTIACSPCNEDKGALTLRQFLAKLQREGDRRALYVAAFIERHTKHHRLLGRRSRLDARETDEKRIHD